MLYSFVTVKRESLTDLGRSQMEDMLMFKRIAVLAATLSVVAILGAGQVGSAFAQGPTPTQVPAAPAGAGLQIRGGFRGGPAWGGDASLEVVAKLTGLTEAEIQIQRQAGQSLAAIAKAKGVTEDALLKAILVEKKSVLDAQVKAGTLTQVQADAIWANMQEQVKTAVERTTTGPQQGRGNGMCAVTGVTAGAAGSAAGAGTPGAGAAAGSAQGMGGGRGRMGGFNR
jgi:hypothetical protein